MAGIMMKVIRSARPGDWIQVGDITGRVTEMDLLHTEVQTEFRDLVTVPNLTMVTQPLHVVRASGTIITAEVSLGYDVPHQKIRQALCAAAEKAGLSGAFAQVRQLGDFSVSYRVGGLLEDVQSLISARSALRVEILDGLHAAGIEIVSPTFMNTLQRSPGESVIPIVAPTSPRDESQASESLAFDKAEAAANIEALRKEILDLTATIEAALNNDELDDEEIEELQFRKERLIVELADLENQHKQNED